MPADPSTRQSELFADTQKLEKNFVGTAKPESPGNLLRKKREPSHWRRKLYNLRSKLNRYTSLYEAGTPEITDREFDNLILRLKKLEKRQESKKSKVRRRQIQLITASPTQRVGGAPSEKFARVRHLVPMLSLDKVEAAEHPTSAEQPDREKRSREQDENTLARLRAWTPRCANSSAATASNT